MKIKRLTSKLLLAGSSVALALGSLPIIPLTSSPSLAQSAGFCECVGYVKNRFGIQVAVGNAKDMIYSLPNLSFRRVSGPQPGAIVVMQPSFPNVNQTYGHVGIVQNVLSNGQIEVRGANQGGSQIEYNCNNVNTVRFATSVNGRSDVSFWVRGNTSSGQQGFTQARFSAWVMSTTGVNLRNSPRLADRSNQNVAYRQTLSFDGWTYGETVNDLQLGTPDARWYKVAGQNLWVPSAYVYGNAPNSRPMP
jgi:surface antigen